MAREVPLNTLISVARSLEIPVDDGQQHTPEFRAALFQQIQDVMPNLKPDRQEHVRKVMGTRPQKTNGHTRRGRGNKRRQAGHHGSARKDRQTALRRSQSMFQRRSG